MSLDANLASRSIQLRTDQDWLLLWVLPLDPQPDAASDRFTTSWRQV